VGLLRESHGDTESDHYTLTPGSGALAVIGMAGSSVRGTEGKDAARRWLERLIAEEDEALMLTGDLLA